MTASNERLLAVTIGRAVGILVLSHFALALTLPYILLNRAVGSADFLQSAAQAPGSMRAAALLFLVSAVITLATTVATYPAVRRSSYGLSVVLLALSVANIALQGVESGMVLSMLSLAQRASEASSENLAVLQTIAAASYGARRWAHDIQLLTVVSWVFVLFAALWRARIIPRPLAIAGLVTSALQIAGVPLRALLGYPVIMQAAMPLGPVYVGLGLWLLARGFGHAGSLGFERAGNANSLGGSTNSLA